MRKHTHFILVFLHPRGSRGERHGGGGSGVGWGLCHLGGIFLRGDPPRLAPLEEGSDVPPYRRRDCGGLLGRGCRDADADVARGCAGGGAGSRDLVADDDERALVGPRPSQPPVGLPPARRGAGTTLAGSRAVGPRGAHRADTAPSLSHPIPRRCSAAGAAERPEGRHCAHPHARRVALPSDSRAPSSCGRGYGRYPTVCVLRVRSPLRGAGRGGGAQSGSPLRQAQWLPIH